MTGPSLRFMAFGVEPERRKYLGRAGDGDRSLKASPRTRHAGYLYFSG